MSEVFYKKNKNGRYKPLGVLVHENQLSDGVWLINSKPGCRSLSRINFLGEAKKPVDVITRIAFENEKDQIVEDISKYFKEQKGNSFSFYDMAEVVITKIIKRIEFKEKTDWDKFIQRIKK